MDTNQSFRQRAWMLIVAAIAVLIAIAFVIFLITSRREAHANLEVIVAPLDTTIKIQDHTYKPGKLTLPPGNYKITAEREGFAPLSQDATVGSDLKQVALALTPV